MYPHVKMRNTEILSFAPVGNNHQLKKQEKLNKTVYTEKEIDTDPN